MFIPKENIPLNNLNTFKTGGSARFFAEVKNLEDLKKAVSFAKRKKLPFFVLGKGSNVLISDEGFGGIVLRIDLKGKDMIASRNNVRVNASAGEDWDAFVEETVKENLYGLENLSGIPGSVGASPVQNIGAYGKELKEVVEYVTVFDTDEMKEKRLSSSECKFEYRNSIFKSHKGKNLIVTSVAFLLNKKGEIDISYKDLKKFFDKKKKISLRDMRKAILTIRKNKFPNLSEVGSAGSFFKNPVVPKDIYLALIRKNPNMPGFELESGDIKIPLAWLIDNVLHLKGAREGDVAIHKKQAIVLVNKGTASSKEIFDYAKDIQKQVEKVSDITPEFEVCLIGKF